MRRLGPFFAVALVALFVAAPSQAAPLVQRGATTTYSVLYARGASTAAAHAAITAAGGTITHENLDIGFATVRSANLGFVDQVNASPALYGAALDSIPVGYAPPGVSKPSVERETGGVKGKGTKTTAASGSVNEPLFKKQWGMRQIDAGPDGSWGVNPGSPDVLVGILDTGVDASHPDIAPNFNWELSRNFTKDRPIVDGPCDEEPDHSCKDGPGVDEGGHGTHVAGIVAAALNGIGVAGVAPNVSIVNIRAGQDSGFFFLQPSVDALTYAGDNGIDVVNMSYYIDPWLYNCTDNPADSPNEQRQQATIIEATNRALDYAHDHGVTLVAALGNEHTDLGHPTFDATSPDYPPGNERDRTVDNSCLDMPTEGHHVIGVSATGVSERKAYYSNYGVEQTQVAAPGGDRREYFGTQRYNSPATRILSTYPHDLALAEGDIDENNNSLSPFVVVNCRGDVCGVYEYLQGTSMASPHAVGVVALLVSHLGVPDPVHGGLRMNPDAVLEALYETSPDHACPPGGSIHYPDPDLPPEFDATCEGTTAFNGFYGYGIVNALNAVTA